MKRAQTRASPMLPRPLTTLIGREDLCQRTTQHLAESVVRLCTLTGPGGVGKTRVALEVALRLQDTFADGVCFLSLASVHDPALIWSTIGHTLGLEMRKSVPLAVLCTALENRRLLLVLDNLEHLLSIAASLSVLLATCPGLTILATSRQRLEVEEEHEIVVPPLPVPDLHASIELTTLAHNASIQLFLERAQARQPGFTLNQGNAPDIAAVCARLDGLPLALELAAARLSVLSPRELLTRLGDMFSLLTSGYRGMPDRQQTLRKALQWSYDLLTEAEQQVFRLMGVFINGGTLDALVAVCRAVGHSPQDLAEVIAALRAKSLLQLESPPGSFQILGTIRAFGREVLLQCGELAQAEQAHAQYFLTWVEAQVHALYGAEQGACLQRVASELDNLRAAMAFLLEHRCAPLVSRFAVAMGPFWLIWGYHHQQTFLAEGQRFITSALSLNTDHQSLEYARMLSAFGVILVGRGERKQGEALCQEALVLLRSRGDSLALLEGLWMLAQANITGSNYEGAGQAAEEALQLARRYPETKQNTFELWALGYSLFLAGHAATWNGRYKEAAQWLQEGCAVCCRAGDRFFASWTRLVLGQIAAVTGQLEEARALLEESQKQFMELGMVARVAAAQRTRGGVALQAGKISEARALLLESHQLARTGQDLQSMAWAEVTLAKVELLEQRNQEAEQLLVDAMEKALFLEDHFVLAASLEALGMVAAARGEAVRAVRIWGKAEALREEAGAPMFPVERSGYTAWTTHVRTMLGERSFQRAWTQGRKMTSQQADAVEEIPSKASPVAVARAPRTRRIPGLLTKRERDVLRELCEGLTTPQIAERLVLQPVTVSSYLRSIYSKLGVSSRTAAMRQAIEQHLLT